MSAGVVNTKELKLDWSIEEDPDRMAEFQSRIDARQLIEVDDWMPHNYRVGMLRNGRRCPAGHSIAHLTFS